MFELTHVVAVGEALLTQFWPTLNWTGRAGVTQAKVSVQTAFERQDWDGVNEAYAKLLASLKRGRIAQTSIVQTVRNTLLSVGAISKPTIPPEELWPQIEAYMKATGRFGLHLSTAIGAVHPDLRGNGSVIRALHLFLNDNVQGALSTHGRPYVSLMHDANKAAFRAQIVALFKESRGQMPSQVDFIEETLRRMKIVMNGKKPPSWVIDMAAVVLKAHGGGWSGGGHHTRAGRSRVPTSVASAVRNGGARLAREDEKILERATRNILDEIAAKDLVRKVALSRRLSVDPEVVAVFERHGLSAKAITTNAQLWKTTPGKFVEGAVLRWAEGNGGANRLRINWNWATALGLVTASVVLVGAWVCFTRKSGEENERNFAQQRFGNWI